MRYNVKRTIMSVILNLGVTPQVSRSPMISRAPIVAPRTLEAPISQKGLITSLAGRVKAGTLAVTGAAGMITMCGIYGIFCATGLFALSSQFARIPLMTISHQMTQNEIEQFRKRYDVMNALVEISIMIGNQTLFREE